jgi:hypothetical protein
MLKKAPRPPLKYQYNKAIIAVSFVATAIMFATNGVAQPACVVPASGAETGAVRVMYDLPGGDVLIGSEQGIFRFDHCWPISAPIWCSGYNHGYNIDGYWTRTDGNQLAGYVQVFRNGIIESAAGDVRSKIDSISLFAQSVEQQIAERLENYMKALSHADVPPPMLAMEAGVRMHNTIVSAGPRFNPIQVQPLSKPDIVLPVITLDNYGQINDYRKALRPIFDAVWNAAGHEASPSYGPDGRWLGHG